MFRFPDGFVKIRYPGYAWSIDEKSLYSFKGGLLRKMRLRKAYRGYSKYHGKAIDVPAGYQISHEGKRVIIPMAYLARLKEPNKDQIVEYKE